jgi:hypothetical protein
MGGRRRVDGVVYFEFMEMAIRAEGFLHSEPAQCAGSPVEMTVLFWGMKTNSA